MIEDAQDITPAAANREQMIDTAHGKEKDTGEAEDSDGIRMFSADTGGSQQINCEAEKGKGPQQMGPGINRFRKTGD